MKERRHAVLENLAVFAGHLAKAPVRQVGRTVKCADKIGKIGKTNVQRDELVGMGIILFCVQRYRCYPIESSKALHPFVV